MGLAAALKIYPAVFLALLAARGWRAALSAAAVVTAAVAGAGIASGFGEIGAFRRAVTIVAGTYGNAPNNYALWSRLSVFGAWSHATWLMMLVGAVLVGVTLIASRRRAAAAEVWTGARVDRDLGAFACLATLLPPVVWQHYFSMLLVPLAVTARIVLGRASRATAVTWCVIVLLLSMSDAPVWALAGAPLQAARTLGVLLSPTTAVAALWFWCLRADAAPAPGRTGS